MSASGQIDNSCNWQPPLSVIFVGGGVGLGKAEKSWSIVTMNKTIIGVMK